MNAERQASNVSVERGWNGHYIDGKGKHVDPR